MCGAPEDETSLMVVAAKRERWGVDGFTFGTVETTGKDGMACEANEAGREGLAIWVFGVEGEEKEVEDILRKARTGRGVWQ